MASRSDLVWYAKVAEQAELYTDMFNAMKQIISLTTELTIEERNLFSVAAKNIVGNKRASWRILYSIQQRVTRNENDIKENRKKIVCNNYTQQVETELIMFCLEVRALTTSLIEISSLPESRMFFYKMRADYCRYLAEVTTGEEKEEYTKQSTNDFDMTSDILQTEFSATHPIRLGMALSYSVFNYEILNRPERAIKMAREAFDAAIAELDSLDEDSYREAALQLSMLRDNLALWTSDLDSMLEHA